MPLVYMWLKKKRRKPNSCEGRTCVAMAHVTKSGCDLPQVSRRYLDHKKVVVGLKNVQGSNVHKADLQGKYGSL